jgi:hypothetical protein
MARFGASGDEKLADAKPTDTMIRSHTPAFRHRTKRM